MAEFFAYNNDNFLPEYLPGITGYGQRGANGNIGDQGSSVYFSSIIFVLNPTEQDDDYVDNPVVTDRILNGVPLSDNERYSYEDKINYKVNDIILDRTGKFYVIKVLNPEEKIVKITSVHGKFSNNLSEVSTAFTKFIVYCNTAYTRSNSKKWVQPNASYIGTDDDTVYLQTETISSPKVYHAKNKEQYLFGNFVKFELSCIKKELAEKYQYKYVLCFPNGQTIESFSTSLTTTIFIDNKMLFGHFDVVGWNNMFNFNISDLNTVLYGNEKEHPVSLNIGSKLGNLQKCAGSGYNKNYNFSTSDEDNTVLCSYFIKHNCSAYVEISNIETGQTYRLDALDFKYSEGDEDENTYEGFNRIREGDLLTNWEVDGHSDDNISRGEPLQLPLNTFDSYVFLSEKETIFGDGETIALSEDGIVQNVHYVGARGFSEYVTLFSADAIFLHNYLPFDKRLEEWEEFVRIANYTASRSQTEALVHSDNRNEHLPLISDEIYELGISKLKLSQSIDNFNSKDYNHFLPSAVRQKHNDEHYNDSSIVDKRFKTLKLKFKDIEQLVFNIVYNKFDEPYVHPFDNSLVEYPLAKVYISGVDSSLFIPDDSSYAIQYLAKVVPPGYTREGSVQGSDAGVADITINLKDLKVDPHKEHTIEIGVALLDVDIISSKYADYLETMVENTLPEIDSIHTPLKYTIANTSAYYSFLTPGSANKPELKIFVSSISELSDEYTSEGEEQAETIETPETGEPPVEEENNQQLQIEYVNS